MRARHKKILKAAKGYYGARSRTFRSAKPAVIRAAVYAYRDRKQKKRVMRALWIVRLNAAVREHGLSYSRFINGLLKANIQLNRNVLANLAITDKKGFESVVVQAKQALESKGQEQETTSSIEEVQEVKDSDE